MPGRLSILDTAWSGSPPRLPLPARGRRALESKNDARPGTCAVFCGSRGFPALQAQCMGPSLPTSSGQDENNLGDVVENQALRFAQGDKVDREITQRIVTISVYTAH